MNCEFPHVQAGFRKGRRTRHQIDILHWMDIPTSALLTMQKPLTVWITTNCGKLTEMGIPDHLTCLLRNLYAGQEATVRTELGTAYWFQIGIGVGKGCVLTPCLFKLYAE